MTIKEQIPINVTSDDVAFAIKASYNKNFAISTATGGGKHFPCTAVEEIWQSDDFGDIL